MPDARCLAGALLGAACPEARDCPTGPRGVPGAPALMPRDGAGRIVLTVLRFIAAARDTGDAACFDVALDHAEAAFGLRDGAMLIGRSAALLRCLEREEAAVRFLPPSCRRLSPGEADLLAAVRSRLGGSRMPAPGLPPRSAWALADVVDPLASSGSWNGLASSPSEVDPAIPRATTIAGAVV